MESRKQIPNALCIVLGVAIVAGACASAYFATGAWTYGRYTEFVAAHGNAWRDLHQCQMKHGYNNHGIKECATLEQNVKKTFDAEQAFKTTLLGRLYLGRDYQH